VYLSAQAGASSVDSLALYDILISAKRAVNSYKFHQAEQAVTRSLTRLIIVFLALLLLNNFSPAAAQETPGAICVSAFADTNGSGLRDASEAALGGVNVNLSTGGVIVAAHVLAAGEPQYCFENLLPGYYTVTFTDSPTYRTTTSNEGTFALAGGQRLTINGFGAVPIPTANLGAEVAAQVVAAENSKNKPLEKSERLLLSVVASMVVMVFMIGVGAVILGLISGRKRRPPQSVMRTQTVALERDRRR
jgi:hypothetical protein